MSIAEPSVVTEGAQNAEVASVRGAQRSPDEIATTLARLQPTDGSEAPSIRALSRETNIPESTIRSWQDRIKESDLDPELAAFFASPAGTRFLHRLTVALLFSHGLMGGSGPSRLRLFYNWQAWIHWWRARIRRFVRGCGNCWRR